MTRRGGCVVVLGACGGCGASMIAGAVALAWARAGRDARLLELDLDRGDVAGAWDVPADRTVADLAPVAGELAPAHVGRVAHRHRSGVELVLAPGRPGAAAAWGRDEVARLVAAAADGAECVVDGGPHTSHVALAAAAHARDVLVVAPATMAGARRALRAMEALAATGVTRPPGLVVNLGAGMPELGPGAVGLLAGSEVFAVLPRARDDAADLLAGRWPRGRGRGLARVVEDMAARVPGPGGR